MTASTGRPAIRYEVEGRVGVITIDRPEARNAVNADVAQGIEAAIDRIEGDESVWVGILTGVPPVFSAGADLKEIQAGHRDRIRTQRGGFAGLVARERVKPLIAAVDGPALGGGTEICLACDLIVASSSARFGLPEVKRSLVAAGGALFRLPARVPLNLATEMALTGEPIDAERAYHFGMVNRLVEPGRALEGAIELAHRIAANPPVAVGASRRVILATASGNEQVGWELSAEAMSEALASQDAQEGLAAFTEKRAPNWSGK